jgi:ribose transport system substrate-binding protein
MTLKTKTLLRAAIAGVLGATVGSFAALVLEFRTAPSRPIIAFVARTSGTNLTEDMRRGAEAAAEGAGYQIYWNAPTRADDVDRQVRIAEKAVERGAEALIIGPTNPWGVTTVIDRLIQRKMPIVVVQTESPVPTGTYVTTVTPDQEDFGRIGADRIAEITGGVGRVAIVGLDRGEPETLARAQSFMDEIEKHPGIEVVAQSSGSVQMLEAEQSIKGILNAYPDLKALFAVSADATQGAMLVLQDAKSDRRISLVGSDRDLFLMDSLRDGKIDSLIAADGYRIGYLAVMAALDGTRGRPLERPVHVRAALLTRKDAQNQ